MNEADAAKLLARMAEVSDPDYYEALVMAGLDETQGDLDASMKMADEILAESKST